MTIESLQNDLQETAEQLAPSITLYGLADPETVSIDPDAYAQSLQTRIRVEEALATQKRQANADIAAWSFADGLYYRYGDARDENISKVRHPLFPEEATTARTIDKSLDTQDEPVVALDFGGGMGLSWMRIAAQPKYRTAIEASRLVMAVTNLGSTPNYDTDERGYSGIPRSMHYINRDYPEYTTDDLKWVQDNQHYVQYLDANALELPLQTVDLADGTTLPLRDHVGVIHERLSLAHTHAPDIALAGFRRLLNSRGVLRSEVATYYHLMHPELFSKITLDDGEVVSVDRAYSYQRRLGLVVGAMLLQNTEFTYNLDDQRSVGEFIRTSL